MGIRSVESASIPIQFLPSDGRSQVLQGNIGVSRSSLAREFLPLNGTPGRGSKLAFHLRSGRLGASLGRLNQQVCVVPVTGSKACKGCRFDSITAQVDFRCCKGYGRINSGYCHSKINGRGTMRWKSLGGKRLRILKSEVGHAKSSITDGRQSLDFPSDDLDTTEEFFSDRVRTTKVASSIDILKDNTANLERTVEEIAERKVDFSDMIQDSNGALRRDKSTEAETDTKGSRMEDFTNRFKLRNGREVLEERAYLVGIERNGMGSLLFDINDSLAELAQLADTAGLLVVGSTYQRLDHPSPRTYIGSGKVLEVQAAVRALGVETVIFDDELSPGQLRNLEKSFGDDVRVCDRTALILDIFSQRAATREATLQVELGQMEYQLPRLTRMWTHLERQAGGMVKGMGEKQIEVDKRILRNRMSTLRRELDSVREHRRQYRDRRASVPIPVVSLVGYTNAGKSTLLNRLCSAGVLAENRLFATLDPITRRIRLLNGKECLITDTVGFIQKLPTQLVASFRATLEEINDSSLLVHVVDISHPLARQQMEAVEDVLTELNVRHIPQLLVWNKVDNVSNQESIRMEAAKRDDIVCMSALTGEGIETFLIAIQQKLKESLVWVEAVVPYVQGDLVDTIHRLGIVDQLEYMEHGVSLKAHVPLALSRQLQPMRQPQ